VTKTIEQHEIIEIYDLLKLILKDPADCNHYVYNLLSTTKNVKEFWELYRYLKNEFDLKYITGPRLVGLACMHNLSSSYYLNSKGKVVGLSIHHKAKLFFKNRKLHGVRTVNSYFQNYINNSECPTKSLRNL
jgi:hypothetical protein